jgi:hypothetical protein
MAYVTINSSVEIAEGTVVQNSTAAPTTVEPHTTGNPVGLAIRCTADYDFTTEPPTLVGYKVKVTYGGGDNGVAVATPSGYDGRISRFDVGNNGTITPVETGGYGYIVGTNPTWATWGT